MQVAAFTFNPFSENTYVLHDGSGQCAIIDPGCSTAAEEQELEQFIVGQGLTPVALWQTHCHIDHIMGCHFVYQRWGLAPWVHADEVNWLQNAAMQGSMFGVEVKNPPAHAGLLAPDSTIRFGNTELTLRHAPGHSPGSLCLYHAPSAQILSGDVLFAGSIGRTDLPGGSYPQLMQSIYTQLLTLPDDTVVYSGHGPATTIGDEKRYNPFLQEGA